MLIAMAGLPGTGKSTLAAALGRELRALVLNKDEVRARLFPGLALDYTREQDDICLEAMYRASAYIIRHHPRQAVILDGRSFLGSGQVAELSRQAEAMGQRPAIIECVCADAVARARLEHDQAAHSHPAGNRTFELYLRCKAQAQPIVAAHLVLDTGETLLAACVQRCLAYVQGS